MPDKRPTTKAVCWLEFVVCRLPWAAHGKAFAMGILAFVVCPWHTANNPIPVVSPLVSPRQVSKIADVTEKLMLKKLSIELETGMREYTYFKPL